MSVDLARCPEILFKPAMIGIKQVLFLNSQIICQAGISEVILRVLKKYPFETQKQLLKNVFLTGGPSKIDNLSNRIKLDLQANLPIGIEININIAQDNLFDAWQGMKVFSLTPGNE